MLGSSLQAKLIINANQNIFDILKGMNLPDLFICSDVEMLLNTNINEDIIEVDVELASGGKCQRCWKIVKEVNENNEICSRCKSVVKS
jgi:isoleucyl-tRNA synthetase